MWKVEDMETVLYNQKECSIAECRRETPVEQLQRRKSNLEKELERVNIALKALEENPTITDVMEKVARALS